VRGKPCKRFKWPGKEKEILAGLAKGSKLAETAAGTVEYATEREVSHSVIHGKKGADVKFSDGEYAASTIPGAEHYWIETGTHFGFWLSDQADEAQKTAIDFLKTHVSNP
jgi:hypothetical protein